VIKTLVVSAEKKCGKFCYTISAIVCGVMPMFASAPESDLVKTDPAIENAENADFQPDGIPYDIKFKGQLTKPIYDMIQDVSYLIRLQERPPSSFSGLGKRAEKDKKRFKEILRAFGFFNGDVSFRISPKDNQAVVKFTFVLGKRYKISDISLEALDNPKILSNKNVNLTYDILGVHPGEHVNIGNIKLAAKKLKRYLQDNGYPFADVKRPYAYVDHKKHEVIVTFPLETGILAIIQETKVLGLKDVGSTFVENRLKWATGDMYCLKAIESTRQTLSETQLIASVDVTPKRFDTEPVVGKNGETIPRPIMMETKITEGPPRAIGAGLNYATAEGLGGKVFWHHNNIFGGQEHFGISYRHGKRQKRFKIEFDVPDCFVPNQKLGNEVVRLWESNRAYTGQVNSVTTKLERPFLNDTLKGALGVTYEKGALNHEGLLRTHRMVGVPIEANIDLTNDKLDPSGGVRIYTAALPYFGQIYNTKKMVLLKSKASMYIPFSKDELENFRTLLALYGKIGTVFIDSNKNLPVNKRYFGGGAGSVRAYGFQLLGPVDKNRVPVGGRSILEMGAEWRFRFTETIGAVAFIEAGSVATKKMPNFKPRNILWGPGVGFRYYTSFAPIRVDFAFPTKRRKIGGRSIDSPVQFYVSIGQAF
jgi:translocation and assembly module TamA